jgi:hypothetical protein
MALLRHALAQVRAAKAHTVAEAIQTGDASCPDAVRRGREHPGAQVRVEVANVDPAQDLELGQPVAAEASRYFSARKSV